MTKNYFSKTSSTATLPVALRLLAGTAMVISLQSCAVVAVADAAVTVVATGVKVTAQAVGALADAVIPESNGE